MRVAYFHYCVSESAHGTDNVSAMGWNILTFIWLLRCVSAAACQHCENKEAVVPRGMNQKVICPAGCRQAHLVAVRRVVLRLSPLAFLILKAWPLTRG